MKYVKTKQEAVEFCSQPYIWADHEMIKSKKSGWDVYYNYVSWHPWKDRPSTSRRVAYLTNKEADIVCQSLKSADEKAQAKAKTKAEEVETRLTWIETLPDEVNGLVVDKAAKGICDEYGNFLFPLPVKPRRDFEKWVISEAEDYFSCCE